VADFSVNGVGKVERGSAARQSDDVALGRKNEGLVRIKIDLERLHEVAWVDRLLLPIHDSLQPRHLRLRRLAPLLILVEPVSGDPILGGAMHFLRSDLDLNRSAPRPHQGRVQ
jgi:hypothetical protein